MTSYKISPPCSSRRSLNQELQARRRVFPRPSVPSVDCGPHSRRRSRLRSRSGGPTDGRGRGRAKNWPKMTYLLQLPMQPSARIKAARIVRGNVIATSDTSRSALIPQGRGALHRRTPSISPSLHALRTDQPTPKNGVLQRRRRRLRLPLVHQRGPRDLHQGHLTSE